MKMAIARMASSFSSYSRTIFFWSLSRFGETAISRKALIEPLVAPGLEKSIMALSDYSEGGFSTTALSIEKISGRDPMADVATVRKCWNTFAM